MSEAVPSRSDAHVPPAAERHSKEKILRLPDGYLA